MAEDTSSSNGVKFILLVLFFLKSFNYSILKKKKLYRSRNTFRSEEQIPSLLGMFFFLFCVCMLLFLKVNVTRFLTKKKK